MYLETLITEIIELISSTRYLCYENLVKKINNPQLRAKRYWSIIKTFYIKKNPTNSILLIGNMFVTNTKQNKFFTRVLIESWESWEIEQTVLESHGIFFFFKKSWEIHGIFIVCILEILIWLLLNTLLEVFVAESIKLTLFTYKDYCNHSLIGLDKF